MFKIQHESNKLLKKLLILNGSVDDCIEKQMQAIKEIEKLDKQLKEVLK